MVTPFRSPLPFSTTLTTPPPDEPSISIDSNSACIACIFDCSSAAFFIMPMKSAMSCLSLLPFAVALVVIGRYLAVGRRWLGVARPHGDNLRTGEAFQYRLHQRIAAHALLEFGFARIGLRLQCRLTWFARQSDEPLTAGPARNLRRQFVHQRRRRTRFERDLELAVFTAHQSHVTFKRGLDLQIAPVGCKLHQFLEISDA